MLTKYVNHQSAFLMKLCAAAHCCTKSFSGPLLLNLNIRHFALLTNLTERAVHRGTNAVLDPNTTQRSLSIDYRSIDHTFILGFINI